MAFFFQAGGFTTGFYHFLKQSLQKNTIKNCCTFIFFLSNSTERAMEPVNLSWPAKRPVLMLAIQILKVGEKGRYQCRGNQAIHVFTRDTQANLKEEMK